MEWKVNDRWNFFIAECTFTTVTNARPAPSFDTDKLFRQRMKIIFGIKIMIMIIVDPW